MMGGPLCVGKENGGGKHVSVFPRYPTSPCKTV